MFSDFLITVSGASKCRIQDGVAHCYYLFTGDKNFDSADQRCASRGERLATISSRLEYKFVVKRMESGEGCL